MRGGQRRKRENLRTKAERARRDRSRRVAKQDGEKEDKIERQIEKRGGTRMRR